MSRNASSVADLFKLPHNCLVELGTRVQILFQARQVLGRTATATVIQRTIPGSPSGSSKRTAFSRNPTPKTRCRELQPSLNSLLSRRHRNSIAKLGATTTFNDTNRNPVEPAKSGDAQTTVLSGIGMTSMRVTALMPLLVVMVAPMLPAFAQTKMFKCVVDGHTVYQQTACPVIPQVEEAASAPHAASTSTGAVAPRTTKREKAAARAAISASTPATTATPTD